MSGLGRASAQVRFYVALAMFWCLGIGTSFWGDVYAQIRIEVPRPGGAGIPIAIAPLANPRSTQEAAFAETFITVLRSDLRISGLFKVINSNAYVEHPRNYKLEQIRFSDWDVLDALALVKGAFWVDGDTLTVEVRLFDVTQQKTLGGRRYQGRKEEVHRMAHRFADQIMLFLTGEKGPFDSRIAFVSKRRGNRAKEIYVTDLSGSELRKLTNEGTLNLNPSWNAAGTELFFISYKLGGPYAFRLSLTTERSSRLYPQVSYGGRWSPGGDTLVISAESNGNSDLFLLSKDGRLIRRLTRHPAIDVSPSWSPDGRHLVFCSGRSGTPQIFIMNVDSGKIRRLTFQGRYNTDPEWSPKGDIIAYSSRAGGFTVMSINRDGGQMKKIARGEHPSWAPDGRYLVITRRGRLYVVSKDGRSSKQLTGAGGDDTSPSWSVRFR